MHDGLNPLDIIFLVILLAAAVRCAFRGFVSEIVSMASLILGIGGAIVFSGVLSVYIEAYFGSSVWNRIIAFLVIFIVVYIILKLIEGMVQDVLENVELQGLDRALGFFLGIIEGVMIIYLLLFLLLLQPFYDPSEMLEESIFAPILMKFIPYGTQFIEERLLHI